ncbi:hypothetical protein HDU97_004005 [Phlyctochytrium planicorne]|nr:hypothetical protein HDU97_004005 [Phlyctochytrium planicorne]
MPERKKAKKGKAAAPDASAGEAGSLVQKTSITEIPAFPRGHGGSDESRLSALEVREINERVSREVAMESIFREDSAKDSSMDVDDDADNPGEQKKRKRRPQPTMMNKKTKRGKDAENADDSTTREAAGIMNLSFKRLKAGVKMLGVIREVNDLDAVVSLPNQLTGFISITEVSTKVTSLVEQAAAGEDGSEEDIPSLTKLLYVGQLIPCTIVSLENDEDSSKRRIELSIKPSFCNKGLKLDEVYAGMTISASVVSVEDHGYIVDYGLDGVKGFLLKKKCTKFVSQHFGGNNLAVGQTLCCNITEVNQKMKLISVGADDTLFTISKDVILPFGCFMPGLLVQGKVKAVKRNGITISFMGLFEGSISISHLGLSSQEQLDQTYKSGQSITARIIYIDEDSKSILLTRRQVFMDWSFEPCPVEFGFIWNEVEVVRVEEKLGLFVKCPNGLIGYVHISRVSDAKITEIDSDKYEIGTRHRARVVGFDFSDGLLLLSMKESTLNAPFLRKEDIVTGSIVKGNVAKIESYGIHVSLTESITALVPQSHLSETKLSNVNKLFKVGMQVKCRVLSNDLATKKVSLTLKKSLINSTLPPVLSYDRSYVGTITEGFVLSVRDFGCIIGFYNDVKAIAPLSELSDRYIKHASDLFTVGEVVKCRVLFADAEAKKMTVSMKLSHEGKETVQNVNVGEIVSARVLSMLPEAALLELYPSLARGLLHKSHMSDHLDHYDLIYGSMQEGTELKEVVILEKDLKRGRAVVSAKPLVIQSAKSFKDGYSEGDIASGYVRSCTESKLFVGFPNGRVGVAKISNVSDTYVANVSEVFKLGQTVVCRILSWNDGIGQYEITLKQTQLLDEKQAKAFEVDFISSFFSEKETGSLATPEDTKSLKAWSAKYAIGSVVKGTVKQKTPFGLIVTVEDEDASGVVTIEQTRGSREVGKEVTCRVLDADVGKRILDLKLVDNEEKSTPIAKVIKKIQPSFASRDQIDAIVEVVKTSYLILSLPLFSSCIVYAPTRSFNNAAISSVPKLHRSNQKIKVVLLKLPLGDAKKSSGYSSHRVFASLIDKPVEKVADGKRVVKEPVDPLLTCVEDLKVGGTIKGRVKGITPCQVNVVLGSNLKGRLHVTETALSISLDDIENAQNPFKRFKVGTVQDFTVVGFHDQGKSTKYLPLTHTNPISKTVVELASRSTRKSEVAATDEALAKRHPTLETIEVGDEYIGFVAKITHDTVWVSISPFLFGRVFFLECSDDIEMLKDISKNFPPGLAVRCKVLSKDLDKSELNVSLRTNPQHNLLSNMDKNQRLIGRVTKVDPKKGLVVQIYDKIFGRASFSDITAPYLDPKNDFTAGMLVHCHIIGKPTDSGTVLLSVGDESTADNELKEDDIISGFVKNISEGGLFVDLGHGRTGRVRIKELSDSFVKDWKSLFAIGDRVKGRILSIDSENSRYEITLKESIVDPTSAKAKESSSLTFNSLSKDMKVKGTIKAIEAYGVFIRIDGSNISGLCHKSEISDIPFTSIASLYEIGDPVKAIILKVDKEKKKISFGLKASYFDEADASDDEEDKPAMDVDDEDDEEDDDVEVGEADNDEGEEEEADKEGEDEEDEDETNHMHEDDDEESLVDPDEDQPATKAKSGQSSSISSSIDLFQTLEPLDVDNISDEEEEAASEEEDAMDVDDAEESNAKGKSRKQKKKEKQAAEDKVRLQEEAMLEESAPDSANAFERLLLGSPSSSFLWIKFMAFYVQISDISKARDVAERALKAISFREQGELLNIWVAYLNLENTYGDPESLQKVFNRAITYNEAKAVFLQMSGIYERTGKMQELDDLFQVMVKRFKESCKVWVAYGLSMMKRGKVSEARNILSRSLKSLAKRKHLKIICKFAQMEFKMGEPERGRTLFEGIISNNPKRLDMWSIYLDMEIKNGDVTTTRRLFERSITLKLSSKKMKFLFKKYLDFEKSFGTDAGVENVKQKAMAYVESVSA